jgi:hypothetical protein
MAHARRKIHDVHVRTPTDITTEALRRIGELYAIEAEIRGSPAENALRGVVQCRKNWLFAGGERAVVLYLLIGTCSLEPEAWLRYVLGHVPDWPVNWLRELLPWKTDLTSA